jgi:hypothetical protein
VGQSKHCKSRGIYFFSTEKEMKVINWGKVSFCTPENSISS